MKTTATTGEKYFWNMMGSLANALSTVILSICVNRIIGAETAGVFAFAYANAQLMLTIGAFEVRPFQSTDVKEKYSFGTYFYHRVFTCILMILATVVVILAGHYDYQKCMTLILFSLFKAVEAFTDVYGGRFQQKDRIDISGKLFFIRVTASTIGFIAAIAFTGDLIIGAAVMFVISFGLFFAVDIRYIFEPDRKIEKTGFNTMLSLTKDVLPLSIGVFVLMYLSNAPKYAINVICGDRVQNIYNILFMPAFTINLFSLFVFRPMLTDMSSMWLSGETKSLANRIIRIYGVIIGLTALAEIVAYFFGIPVLSMLYGVDLSGQRENLLLVMVSGGIGAVVTFTYYTVTVMRRQHILLIGYGVSFVFALCFSEYFVGAFGLPGAIFEYMLSTGLLAVIFIIIMLLSLRRDQNENIDHSSRI